MSKVRPQLSKKNEYWLEKHRYYELKHFCLQYEIWKKAYAELDGLSKRPNDVPVNAYNRIGNPTENCGIAMAYYSERMAMIRNTAIDTDMVLGRFIFRAVTEGMSYDALNAVANIPCCRDTYYGLYRRFFWLLDKARR